MAANGLHGDALIRALMETINRLEVQMRTMAEELKKEKGRSEVLQMDLELMKIHREAQGEPFGFGSPRGFGSGMPYGTTARTPDQGARGGVRRSYAAVTRGPARTATREVRVPTGRQEIVVSTAEKSMEKRSAAELLQATRSIWGEKAILRARPLPGGRAALTVAPGDEGRVLATEGLRKAFGPTARVMKRGLRVIAKSIPRDALDTLTLAKLEEWNAFHLTTRRGYNNCGTAVFSVPTFDLGQSLISNGLKVGTLCARSSHSTRRSR